MTRLFEGIMQAFLADWPIERIEAAAFLAIVAMIYGKVFFYAIRRR